MSSNRRITDQQAMYMRQATILRKNIMEWDRLLRTPRGEDWPTMLGRANAALNQTTNMDKFIEDVLDHFVYVPRQATANPQDIPFFLSTRIELSTTDASKQTSEEDNDMKDPIQQLARFESGAARLAANYEENMVRF